MRVCLNTDDPGWFASTLTGELELASERFGLTRTDHVVMQLDALEASLASPSVTRRISGELTNAQAALTESG